MVITWTPSVAIKGGYGTGHNVVIIFNYRLKQLSICVQNDTVRITVSLAYVSIELVRKKFNRLY